MDIKEALVAATALEAELAETRALAVVEGRKVAEGKEGWQVVTDAIGVISKHINMLQVVWQGWSNLWLSLCQWRRGLISPLSKPFLLH